MPGAGDKRICSVTLSSYEVNSLGDAWLLSSLIICYGQAVVEGGAAWQDGRLEAGDQLLAVDGHSLVGITQVRALSQLKQSSLISIEFFKK